MLSEKVLDHRHEESLLLSVMANRSEKNMWILKGLAVGTVIFIVFTVYYLKSIIGPTQANKATSLGMLARSTIQQPLYWLAFLMALGSGVACAYLVAKFS